MEVEKVEQDETSEKRVEAGDIVEISGYSHGDGTIRYLATEIGNYGVVYLISMEGGSIAAEFDPIGKTEDEIEDCLFNNKTATIYKADNHKLKLVERGDVTDE